MLAPPNFLQRFDGVSDNDRELLCFLADNARVANAHLAERGGMAPSTCLGHVQSMRTSGLIVGFHTQIDRRVLGLKLDVLVGLQLRDKQVRVVHTLMKELQELEHVSAVMRTSGAYDLMLHAHIHDTDELLAKLIDPMMENPVVGGTQTIMVTEHWRRASLLGDFFYV